MRLFQPLLSFNLESERCKIIDIYQHFRDEEQGLIDQLIDKCDQVEQQYAPILTNFLDPRGQYILEVISGSYEDMEVTFLVEITQRENEVSLPLIILNLGKLTLKKY